MMRLLFPCAATLAAMLLTAQAACAGALFPKVVVTVAPLKPYVDELMKGHGESQVLLRPGQDAHDFALTLAQAQMLEKADIVIIPDRSMSPFLDRLLAKKKTIQTLELTTLAGAQPLAYSDENPWLDAAKAVAQKNTKAPKKPAAPAQEADDAHTHADAGIIATDPHLWLDPERMAAIALPLAKHIAEHAPEARATLEANAKQLAIHLRGEVMPNLRRLLGAHARELTAVDRKIIPFITYHGAYQYFLARFHLAHYGQIMKRGEERTGAKTLAAVLNGSEKLTVRCLIGEQKNTLMNYVAKSTGARIVLLNPEQLPAREDVDAFDWIKNDYDRLLYVTAKAFGACL